MLLAIIGLSAPGCAKSRPVATAQAACALVTARVTAQRGLPARHVIFCDEIAEADSPAGYYVMALRARCAEDVCGSTLMGWFAIDKMNGDVFEVEDVADWGLGRRVASGSSHPRSALLGMKVRARMV
ncbi:MAG: hypothetical protein KF910_06260 [Brevundimonas sp.]|uniref:hypothetical protein n=1 Tax=Brevundimonas sp. TaxID=1871086 RepID=UPI0025BA54ED|nr:hypothetical protein [Brevundimonas sp.]MBX3477189.1 hypothetical protein [Brevundimonas sp.]